jgi:Protein of unknown function (DUF2865)
VRCELAREVIAVLRLAGKKRLEWLAAGLIGALSAAIIVALPCPARAGFLDFLFGGAQERASPPPVVNSYADPSSAPAGLESLRANSGHGRAVPFCVRLCDGRHFPLQRLSNATPVETCRAMCPASKTKVFYGGEIDHAVAADGAHYTDLDSAFVYRAHLVPNCTCNGKDAFGLAPFDLASDPTLRPGDIVATQAGFKTYAGKRGQSDAFTPADAKAVAAELNGRSSHASLARAGKEPAIADEETGIVVPPLRDVQAAR